jgi:FdrA protein
VRCATVVMGTPLNINTLIADGFSEDPLCQARPNDLIIAIDAVDNESARVALDRLDELLASSHQQKGEDTASPVMLRTLEAALRTSPETEIVVVAVPCQYAAVKAWAEKRLDTLRIRLPFSCMSSHLLARLGMGLES